MTLSLVDASENPLTGWIKDAVYINSDGYIEVDNSFYEGGD